jgi:hypothetical protein
MHTSALCDIRRARNSAPVSKPLSCAHLPKSKRGAMRNALGLLCLFLCSHMTSAAVAAGPAVRLSVNCVPWVLPPPGTHCFDARLGSPVTAYIVAVDSIGQLATSYTGTIHLVSSDPRATLPPDHTFTAADAGIWAAPVTFHSATTSNAPSPEMITATDATTASITGMQFWSVFPAPPVNVPSLSAAGIGLMLLLIAVMGVFAIRQQTPRACPLVL